MIDISKVNVGDRVRITRENGDEATFTVADIEGRHLESEVNVFDTYGWDTLEIVERAFKPVPGLYTRRKDLARYVLMKDGTEYYTSSTGAWIMVDSTPGTDNAQRQKNGWKREITF